MQSTIIESHIRKANGQQIHYLVAGEGPPLVLLHGWPQHSHQWRSIMPLLAERFFVIAPDQRGAGGSTKPRNASYRKCELAKDIHSLIRGLCGEKRINLCGYDHGAGTAYQYAAQWPDEVPTAHPPQLCRISDRFRSEKKRSLEWLQPCQQPR